MNRLGEKLRQLRTQRELTMRQMGIIFDIDGSLISKIETGKNVPSLGLAVRLAEFFEVSLDDLVDDDAEIAE
ncbi:helix-turn-helix transcriptional regulator [Anaerolineales bacterium HSG24]|nr:helix-turn-helix transcriptional regulator [Anaerolineales bacterium HSG24]